MFWCTKTTLQAQPGTGSFPRFSGIGPESPVTLNSPQIFYGVLGAGVMTYYRWYILGRKRVSPFLEYGAGLFCGFESFPRNGIHITVSSSAQLGLEYSFENKNRLRISYGHFHQSTQDLALPDPGYDGNGFSVSYGWFLR